MHHARRIMSPGRALGAFAVAAGTLAAAAHQADAQETERRTLSGRDVAIYNLAGSIRAEAGSGSQVVVEVARRGPDASRLRIESGEVGGRETLRVIYPADRVLFRDAPRGRGVFGSGSRTTLTVRDDGTFGDDRGRGGHRVEIVGRGDGLEASADVRLLVPRDARIALHLGVGEATVTNVNGEIVVDVAAADVTTRGTRGTLTLDTGSGRVSVSDADGQLLLDSGSGEVTVSHVRGDRIRLDSGSGSVRADGLEAPRLELDTGSGGVRLLEVRSGDITIEAGSGSVELGLLADVESLRIDSGSGSVTIRAPKELGAELVADTGSGGIDVDLPMQIRRREHGYLAARIGDGRGKISIDSGSGGVRITSR
jgi:hypothetical protein